MTAMIFKAIVEGSHMPKVERQLCEKLQTLAVPTRPEVGFQRDPLSALVFAKFTLSNRYGPTFQQYRYAMAVTQLLSSSTSSSGGASSHAGSNLSQRHASIAP